MNDRFKFRVWTKVKNDFVKDFFITQNNGVLITDEIGKTYINDNPNYILMQCTGLIDKNGKLIYEGDIVKYKDEVYDLCIGRIQWDNAHYELQYYTGEKYGWFSHILCLKHIKNVEVIGNIYENPELLEDTDER